MLMGAVAKVFASKQATIGMRSTLSGEGGEAINKMRRERRREGSRE
jgi:hypothetical protein